MSLPATITGMRPNLPHPARSPCLPRSTTSANIHDAGWARAEMRPRRPFHMLNDRQTAVGAALRDVLELHFEVRPRTARELGRHEFDGRFPDVARPTVAALQELRGRVAPLESAPDPASRADVRT